ncbi:putative ABC transporter ATP-binding protein [Thalassoglobus neptunius]|uniref:Putative ABC transporter ATP-binding protein n=1 Tax=Thalassoglobus neptunius TaxID=1938619 RepID=A0A5C5X415_9PLAN|nr:ATP-binding cassette domain-containing protein [Thalassoglobus neptunius]TWT57538.1 putative ABC transporter ATP-binding protein [Thalassoglobus neptunius]
MSSLIELENVSRQFGTQQVLRDITLSVETGKTLVLIGESGCGKSVTMKLMMNLLPPSSGTVLWDGRPVKDRTEKEIVRERLRFGYLFQGAALFDSLTVFENVAFGLRQNRRLHPKQISQTVHERLRDVGLDPAIVVDKKPAELSGGMRKRVGLARALAMDPEVMLYDEPTTGLDPIMSDVINELILRTRERCNVTSIVVTHDMNTVQKVADRVVMFYPLARLNPEDPQIIFDGAAEEAFESLDPRVSQFVRGEAGERLQELAIG